MASEPRNVLLERVLREEPTLRAEMTRLEEPFGSTLQAPGQPVPYIHFPAGGVLSSVVGLANGAMAEVSAVGCEGLAGAGALLGLRPSPHAVVQQVPGAVWRVRTTALVRAQRTNRHVASLFRCYAAYLLLAAHQSIACNALHGAAPRAARWILATADRAGRDEFLLTQEVVALMLSVSRQSVNEIVVRFRGEGLIDYARGRIRVLDRGGLERHACECYAIIRDTYDKVLR
jgi:CRP-like cAMP-binding protein